MVNLYRIQEISDLYVDAALQDIQSHLMFISIWGLDTAIQSFISQLSLPCTKGGINKFTIASTEGNTSNYSTWYYYINHADDLKKHTGRVNSKNSLFHGLVNLWVYDKSILNIDYANRRCVLLKQHTEDTESFSRRLWEAIKIVCPVPLLDEWKTIIEDFQRLRWVIHHQGIQVDGYELDFSESAVESSITYWIREGKLTLPRQNKQQSHLSLVKL